MTRCRCSRSSKIGISVGTRPPTAELLGPQISHQRRERVNVGVAPGCVAWQPPEPVVAQVIGERDLARHDW